MNQIVNRRICLSGAMLFDVFFEALILEILLVENSLGLFLLSAEFPDLPRVEGLVLFRGAVLFPFGFHTFLGEFGRFFELLLGDERERVVGLGWEGPDAVGRPLSATFDGRTHAAEDFEGGFPLRGGLRNPRFFTGF